MDSLRDTIDLHKLRHALAVARAGSFSAAAEHINISQSALTRSVQVLEEGYGIRMFDRGKAGANLTLEGARFMTIAEEALIRAQSTHDELARVSTHQQPPIRFGMGALTAACFLPRLLPILMQHDLRFRYRILIESNTIMQLMLQQGDVDFIVGGLRHGIDLQGSRRAIGMKSVSGGSVSFIVREGHPLLSEGTDPAMLARYPTTAGSFVREMLGTHWLESHGLQLPSLEIDEYPLMYSLVRNSDHIAIASDMLVTTGAWEGMRTLFSVSVSDHIDWAVIWSTSRQLSQPARRAADLTFDFMSQVLLGSDA